MTSTIDARFKSTVEQVRRHRVLPTTLRVEHVPADLLYAITSDWADLCTRSLEDNIFLEPGFALPLMNRAAPSHRPGAIVVWEDGETSRLLALVPIAAPRLSSPGLARGFNDEQAPLGTPLLDHERGAEAFSAILAALSVRWPRVQALVLSRLPAEGAVARMLRAHLPRQLVTLHREERAVLLSTHQAAEPGLPLSAKRRKAVRRQRRRLSRLGTLAYSSACSPAAVAEATERFLSLEKSGWKGRRATALLSHAGTADFARAAMRRLAECGMCRIDTLALDGEALAMGIVLTVRGRAQWWKTTYDERYADFSPGVLFALELTRMQRGDPMIELTDSCAAAGHPMIDSFWPARMPLVDFAVALRPSPAWKLGELRRALDVERCRRACRAWLKVGLRALQRRCRAVVGGR